MFLFCSLPYVRLLQVFSTPADTDIEGRDGGATLPGKTPRLLKGDTGMAGFQATTSSLTRFAERHPDKFGAVLIDPPWRFTNRTGKVAPEHRRLMRYETMSVDELAGLPVGELGKPASHIYLWCPNALLAEGLHLLSAWGFTYKTNIVWYKVRKDGGPDGRGVGFYFRNVTELVLFGVRGSLRTLAPGRRQTNIIVERKREHSRKPPTLHRIIEECSPGPFVELFARERIRGWNHWGDEADTYGINRPYHRGYTWDRADHELYSGSK
jgi:N6-adenosine-specific RNA methylase IME4